MIATLPPVAAVGASPWAAAAGAVRAARAAQGAWAARPVRERVAVVAALRAALAEHAAELAAAVTVAGRRRADTLAAEVLPLAEACRFLEKQAAKLLRTRRAGRRGRPAWLAGVTAEVARQPWGVVLLLAPYNYPLLLPGVQAVQALVAGNAVVLKPGRGGRVAAELLARLLGDAGLPAGLLHVLDESPEAGRAAVDAPPDKVVLTGSLDTGRAVLRAAAADVTPVTCELSGIDPFVVLADADVELSARVLRYAATLNDGQTCIAPRRLIAHESVAGELLRRVGDLLGPELTSAVVSSDAEAVEEANACDHALGAVVMGEPGHAADVAARVRAGVVVINDAVVPTADPRLPFGGRGLSGFGVTRGAEGLLEMTSPRVVAVRRGRFRPHLDAPRDTDEAMFLAGLRVLHGGGLVQRARALVAFLRLARAAPDRKNQP